MRDIIFTSKIDKLCIDETKHCTRFPDSQFKIDEYRFPLFKKVQDSKGVGKIVFVWKGIIAKKSSHSESLSIDQFVYNLLLFPKENGVFLLHIARPPKKKNIYIYINKGEFFNEISNTLSKAFKCYDRIVLGVLGSDLNIDLLDPSKDTSNHLSDLLNVFSLKKSC